MTTQATETAIPYPQGDTEQAIAWSQCDDALTEPYTWLATWWRAITVIAVSAVGAALLVVIALQNENRSSSVVILPNKSSGSIVVPSSEPEHPARPPIAIPPDAQQATLSDADATYLHMMYAGGMAIGNVPEIVEYGHAVCRGRAQGLTEQESVNMIVKYNPQFREHGARITLIAAETAYCRQYLSGEVSR